MADDANRIQKQTAAIDLQGYYGAAGVGITCIGALIALGQSVCTVLAETAVKTWYEVKKIAKSYIDAQLSIYDDSQPRVHHVVPVGSFGNYSADAQSKLKHMQNILSDVGIDVANSGHNLVILSHGYHKSIHTEWYIHFIYDYIAPWEGSRGMVIASLEVLKGILLLGDPQTYTVWR